MSCGMPVAFVSLPLTSSKFQHRKDLLSGHTYCRFSAWWRDSADSGARLGLTGPSLKMQVRVVEEYQYWSSQWSQQCCPNRQTCQWPPQDARQQKPIEEVDREGCSAVLSSPTRCADPRRLQHHRNVWVLPATFLDLVRTAPRRLRSWGLWTLLHRE